MRNRSTGPRVSTPIVVADVEVLVARGLRVDRDLVRAVRPAAGREDERVEALVALRVRR